MIIGIGIDIVDTSRIEEILNKYGKKFESRCFTKVENSDSKKVSNKINFYAKRYAAKEACSKALGTGFSGGILWKDISIINDTYGKPNIKLFDKAKERIKKLTNKSYSIHVSLSDEKNYAVANVIISEKDD